MTLLISDDDTIVHSFVIFYLFGQFFYHLTLSVWNVRSFAFQIREYSSSDWTKICSATLK